MNISDLPHAPANSLTLRVGCALAYEADEASPILLLIHPRPATHHIVVDEQLQISTRQPVERLIDSHGNMLLKTTLVPGWTEIRLDTILCVPDEADNHDLQPQAGANLPYEALRYTLPSRYCESDKLVTFAQYKFGRYAQGLSTVQAICDWTHHHLDYRYGADSSTMSACDAIEAGYGVCRDFAHVMIALCRALDLPARYVAGHMPLFEAPVPGSDIGIDFHAYVEVYVDGAWHVFDSRYNKPHTGRVKIAHGMDAVDAAFATFYGPVRPAWFEVWAYGVEFARARIDDPVLLPT